MSNTCQTELRVGTVGLFLTVLLFASPSSVAQEGVATSDARSSVGEKPVVDWGEDYQIRVFGGNPTRRVFFLSYCREVQDDFRNILLRRRPGEDDRRLDWVIPIRIDLWGRSNEVYKGPDLVTNVEIGPDNRFLIRVSVKVHDRFKEEAFRLELVRVLLIEQMLATFVETPANLQKASIQAPDWLAHGFDELLQHRKDGQPSAFYRGILESGQMLAPDRLLEISDPASLDPVTRAAFRASAAAFVEALLNQPGGDASVRAFLADLGMSDGSNAQPLLRQHFPAFREMSQGMDKWWALEVATMGAQQGFEYMSPEETEKWLSDALTVTIETTKSSAVDTKKPGAAALGFFQRFKKKEPEEPVSEVAAPEGGAPFVGGIEQYDSFLKLPGAKRQLEAGLSRLQRVKQTGFPLYRPVFARYEVILQRLIAGKLKGLDEELETAAKMRVKINETIIKSRDFLNYFEATQSPQRSNAFDDYLKMRRILQSDLMPKRDDRITKFLDQSEKVRP